MYIYDKIKETSRGCKTRAVEQQYEGFRGDFNLVMLSVHQQAHGLILIL